MATFTIILFTDQKNGIKGKYIGHGAIVHPILCAVTDIRCHVTYLQQHDDIIRTPLLEVFHKNKWTPVGSIKITKALRAALHITGPTVVFTPE